MKAVLLEDIGKLTITEIERPALGGPDELLIKVAAVGVDAVCHRLTIRTHGE